MSIGLIHLFVKANRLVQANYSVQFDDFIMFLSAEASDTMYQQPLFGFTFNSSGNHFVSLTAHFVPDGNWLDLDFITITTNDTERFDSAHGL